MIRKFYGAEMVTGWVLERDKEDANLCLDWTKPSQLAFSMTRGARKRIRRQVLQNNIGTSDLGTPLKGEKVRIPLSSPPMWTVFTSSVPERAHYGRD